MIGTAATYSLLFISLYFEIFLLTSFIELRLKRSGTTKTAVVPAEYPSVAIVVPCYNEESGLGLTLVSLLSLDYPKDKLEIIVVDDGSKDKTLEIAHGFTSDPRIKIFHKENGGKHTAMNYALERTDAQLIGCLDADSVVAPEALLNVIPVFENTRVAAVTPGIHTKEPTNMLQHMQKVEYRLSVFNRFMLASLGSAFITPGPFSIFRTSIVKELGGWRHAHSTEDMEMALRMQKAGYLIANAPGAVVHTATPLTVRHLFKQRVRWTYGFLRNAFDYRSMIGNRAYGNLGIIILPISLISIGAGIFFFVRIIYFGILTLKHAYTRYEVTGHLLFHPNLSLFYFNTSVMWFLVCVSIALILALISAGSWIGTGKRTLPIGTPLFVLLYCFLVPLWLATALWKATFKTGVQWR